MALLANESKNRPPINFAKLGERFARLLLATFRIRAGKNDTPSGRYEPVGTLPVSDGGSGVHSRPPSFLSSLQASLKSPWTPSLNRDSDVFGRAIISHNPIPEIARRSSGEN